MVLPACNSIDLFMTIGKDGFSEGLSEIEMHKIALWTSKTGHSLSAID